ncbi:hypothetical protein KJJ97_26980, partial [Escherichia coli]|uniref:hypothetical protein n=1 Tax=Escherichia coli TaxID=562 RepID=UPI001BD9C0DF
VFVFAAGVVPALGVGVVLGVGVGVTGTGQSKMPLGCIMQLESCIKGLCPGLMVIVCPGGGKGAPGGGAPPFAQGL